MKHLNLNIDLKDIKLSKEEKELTPQIMCMRIIKNVINRYGEAQGPNKHHIGFNKADRKSLYTLMNKFKAAERDKTVNTILLEDNVATFITRAFRDATFMPNEIVKLVEEQVENMTDKAIQSQKA